MCPPPHQVLLLLLLFRRAAGSADATSVELDPASEVEARGHMADAGQRCVGWWVATYSLEKGVVHHSR